MADDHAFCHHESGFCHAWLCVSGSFRDGLLPTLPATSPCGTASRSGKKRRPHRQNRTATTDRFDLPEAKLVVKGTATESTIRVSVDGLLFEFYLRFTRTSEIDARLLEVNAIDLKANRALLGFPQKILHAYKRKGS